MSVPVALFIHSCPYYFVYFFFLLFFAHHYIVCTYQLCIYVYAWYLYMLKMDSKCKKKRSLCLMLVYAVFDICVGIHSVQLTGERVFICEEF